MEWRRNQKKLMNTSPFQTKEVLENVLAKLNFKDENDIDELHNKLKSREALGE